jgi:CHASE3 domain sensor protein
MTLGRKILAGFIGCTIILFVVAVFSFKNSEEFIASNAWVDHTHQVITEFEQILVSSVDEETGARGFVITGEPSYLEPFTSANTVIRQSYATKKY